MINKNYHYGSIESIKNLQNFSSRKIIEIHHISGSIYLLCTLQGFIYIIKANQAMEIVLNDVLPFNPNGITNTK